MVSNLRCALLWPNTMTINTLGRVSGHSSLRTLSSWGQSGQEGHRGGPGSRSRGKGPAGVLFTGSITRAHSACSYSAQDHQHRMAPLTASWVLTHPSSVRKVHHRLAFGLIWQNGFLKESLLFPHDSGSRQVINNNNNNNNNNNSPEHIKLGEKGISHTPF